MKVLIVNGPNLNLLGIREKEIYGGRSYKELCTFLKKTAKENKIKISIFQTNNEGKIVDKIQKKFKKFDYLIINGGAYTHTSIAIHDAIKGVNIKTIEVHLSNPEQREEFRKINYIRPVSIKSFVGYGFDSYRMALEYVASVIN